MSLGQSLMLHGSLLLLFFCFFGTDSAFIFETEVEDDLSATKKGRFLGPYLRSFVLAGEELSEVLSVGVHRVLNVIH